MTEENESSRSVPDSATTPETSPPERVATTTAAVVPKARASWVGPVLVAACLVGGLLVGGVGGFVAGSALAAGRGPIAAFGPAGQDDGAHGPRGELRDGPRGPDGRPGDGSRQAPPPDSPTTPDDGAEEG